MVRKSNLKGVIARSRAENVYQKPQTNPNRGTQVVVVPSFRVVAPAKAGTQEAGEPDPVRLDSRFHGNEGTTKIRLSSNLCHDFYPSPSFDTVSVSCP